MAWQLNQLQSNAKRVAGWNATALGFTIPIWAVADSILMGLVVLCWAVSGDWSEKIRRIKTNPVAMAALLLFAWMLLGTFWGDGSLEERAGSLKKYAGLLFIPLLISMAVETGVRRRAVLALAAGLVLTLLLSFGVEFGLVKTGGLIKGWPSNPFVFKKHLTHNVLMAFGVLLFAVLAWQSRATIGRWVWSVLALLAAGNVVLMVHGRTGYVVLAGLVLLGLHLSYGWRGVTAALVLLTVAFAGAYQVSTAFHDRVSLVASGLTQWDPQSVALDPIGERLEFSRRTVEIIWDHPLIGVGTGGFVKAYAEKVRETGFPFTNHPHNQYLLIMAQVGIVGLGLLLWLLTQQWRFASLTDGAAYGLLARGLVLTMAVGCLFNSLLIDHTEKLLYCWFSGLAYSGIGPRSAPAADTEVTGAPTTSMARTTLTQG
jgi:O-antigen ligase